MAEKKKKSFLHSKRKLKAVPVQFIEFGEGLILKRGLTEIQIGTNEAAEAIKLIFQKTSRKGAYQHEILQHFTQKSHPQLKNLLKQLIDWRLLQHVDSKSGERENQETSLDLFYWELGEGPEQYHEILNQHQITVLGVNYISRQLCSVFETSGFENFQIIDVPSLRNRKMIDKSEVLKKSYWSNVSRFPLEYTNSLESLNGVDCLVVTSDLGSSQIFQDWNSICLQQKKHFFPVVLENMIGYLGPHVLPGETACYQCLELRQNSHFSNPEVHQAIQRTLGRTQLVGFHPSMPYILGDLAAFELMKFYSTKGNSHNIGTLIEIDLLKLQLITRSVLKIPRCPACSPMNIKASINPEENIFIPLDWGER